MVHRVTTELRVKIKMGQARVIRYPTGIPICMLFREILDHTAMLSSTTTSFHTSRKDQQILVPEGAGGRRRIS